MVISRPRNNFEGRQKRGSPNSTSTYDVMTATVGTTTVTVPISVYVTPTTTTVVYVTPTTTTTAVYVTTALPPVRQTIATTITSITTLTKLGTSSITSPAGVSVVTATTTVSSTIATADAASTSSQPPLPDHSSTLQRTITGLAVALVIAVIIACLACLCWRRKVKDSPLTRRPESLSAFVPKGSWDSQPATRSSGLGSYTPEPYKLPIQKSAAYGGFGSYFGIGRDSSSGVPDSQTQTLNGDEEFFPRSMSQLECTKEIGVAL